jgi:hypothetical protein
MTIDEFQRAAETELKKCFGIELVDTLLWDREFVDGCITAGESPESMVAWIGEKYGLIRVDDEFRRACLR